MSKNRLSSEETLPIMLSVAGAIGVFPMAVLRLRAGDWLIGLFDLFVVIGMLVLGVYVMRSQRVRLASVLLSILCVIGVIITVSLKGAGQVFWAFPSVLAVFFLLAPREAVVACGVLLVGLAPTLISDTAGLMATTVLITLLVTTAFAYAFSVLTNDQRDQLVNLASRDPLTGAGNRRAFEERLSDIVAANRRTPVNASLLMLDLDHFKRINDDHGHDVGDEILVAVTQLVMQRIRVTDKLYRIGGEEFVIIVDGNINAVAGRLAEELREQIETTAMPDSCAVTVSIGVAQISPEEARRDWLKRADEALYAAKNAGRNQVSVAA